MKSSTPSVTEHAVLVFWTYSEIKRHNQLLISYTNANCNGLLTYILRLSDNEFELPVSSVRSSSPDDASE